MERIIRLKDTLLARHKTMVLAAFLVILFFSGYADLLNAPPQSTHFWRQSDGTSLALNYYQEGMRFFQPQIHNLHADGDTTGYAVSEAPYLYFTVGALYKIFGHEHWVYRGLWTLIFICGFMALYGMARLFLYSRKMAFLTATLLLCSPVIVFYGNSFLPDVPALAFTFCGWLFFAKWLQNKATANLYLTALFFMMAGLLKVTALLSFFSLAGIWFLEMMGVKFGEKGTRIFEERWKAALPFFLSFLIMLLWYSWAYNYNQLHDTIYFSMRTCPIWNVAECCECDYQSVLYNIRKVFLPQLFYKPVMFVLLGCVAFTLAYARYARPLLLGISLFTFLGTLSFFLLWFAAFYEHDYYFINLYVFPVFLLITSLDILRRRFPMVFQSRYFLIAFIVLVLLALGHTFKRQERRYRSENAYLAGAMQIAPYLEKLGITRQDYVVSIPDPTPNYTLYLLNRKGWTDFYHKTRDSLSLQQSIGRGAKYLIVSGFEKELQERPFLHTFLSEPMGSAGGTHVFRIDGQRARFLLQSRQDTVLSFYCNAQEVSATHPGRMQTSHPDILSRGARQRTAEESFSGQYSLGVGGEHAFGFSTTLHHESVTTLKVNVRRKGAGQNGFLVVSSMGGKTQLYHTQNIGLMDEETGWEQLSLSVPLSGLGPKEELTVYVWNPEDDIVYFDQLEVVLLRDTLEVVENQGM